MIGGKIRDFNWHSLRCLSTDNFHDAFAVITYSIFFPGSNLHVHGNNGMTNDDDDDDSDGDDDDDDDLFVNLNHQKTACYVDSDSSEESEDNEH